MQPDGDARGRSSGPGRSGRGGARGRRRRSSRPMPLTVPSTTSRSNHHRASAIRPPMTMNSRWLRSSNHHLLSDARYRNGTRAVSSRTRSGSGRQLAGRRARRRTGATRRRRRRPRRRRWRGSARRRCRTAGTRPRAWPSSCLGLLEDRLAASRLDPAARPSGRPEAAMPRKTDGIASRMSGIVMTARRLVDLVPDRLRPAELAPEREAHQPEHVERGHAGDDEADRPDPAGSRA